MPDIKKFFPSQTVANWTSGAFGGGTTSFSATGGTINTYTDSGTNYKSHTFTSSSTFTVTGGEKLCQVFLVGGGGAGLAQYGNYCSGGAGAGGYLLGSTVLSAIGGNGVGAYTVTIGAGGAGNYTYPYGGLTRDVAGVTGNNSSFSGMVAYGGGGGGRDASKDSTQGGYAQTSAATGGGCGGGSGAVSGRYIKGMHGVQGGRGNDPSGSMHSEVGAGGGGHGGGGTNSRNGYTGANNNYSTGSNVMYGGGGGGCDASSYTSGSGGSGGGGAALAAQSGNATSGTANTGGGGGTCNNMNYYAQMYAGSGGSGIVVIRYEV